MIVIYRPILPNRIKPCYSCSPHPRVKSYAPSLGNMPQRRKERNQATKGEEYANSFRIGLNGVSTGLGEL